MKYVVEVILHMPLCFTACVILHYLECRFKWVHRLFRHAEHNEAPQVSSEHPKCEVCKQDTHGVYFTIIGYTQEGVVLCSTPCIDSYCFFGNPPEKEPCCGLCLYPEDCECDEFCSY